MQRVEIVADDDRVEELEPIIADQHRHLAERVRRVDGFVAAGRARLMRDDRHPLGDAELMRRHKDLARIGSMSLGEKLHRSRPSIEMSLRAGVPRAAAIGEILRAPRAREALELAIPAATLFRAATSRRRLVPAADGRRRRGVRLAPCQRKAARKPRPNSAAASRRAAAARRCNAPPRCASAPRRPIAERAAPAQLRRAR